MMRWGKDITAVGRDKYKATVAWYAARGLTLENCYCAGDETWHVVVMYPSGHHRAARSRRVGTLRDLIKNRETIREELARGMARELAAVARGD